MKGPLYISDDGQKQGTQAEVEAYEAALNPLAKFHFPWTTNWDNALGNPAIDSYTPDAVSRSEASALLNLMPLVEELRQTWNSFNSDWRGSNWGSPVLRSSQKLLLAYEKALGIEQPV